MTIRALTLVLTLWVFYGVLLYIRIRKIRGIVTTRFPEHVLLAKQQRIFYVIIGLIWLTVLILVSLIALFIY